MKNFNNIKYLVYLLAIVCFAYVLPLLWDIGTADATRYPFTYYSSVKDIFCYMDFSSGEMQRKDASGKIYTEAEFDSILPMFNYRQLAVDGRLPDSIKGVPVDAQQIKTKAFFHRYRPRNKFAPQIGLYPLFESLSRKVKIEMPGDVFCMTADGIEFLDPKTNKLKSEKSEEFSTAFRKLGYVGEPKAVAGNPSTRKPYDEGYLIIDQNNMLFHLKMTNGKPFVKKVKLPKGLEPAFLQTTEYSDRRFYGFLMDTENRLYFIESQTYKLVHVPIPAFSYLTNHLLVMGNLFNWNVSTTTETGKTVWAVGADNMQLKDSISYTRPSQNLEHIPKYVFPAVLEFTSTDHDFVKAELSFGGFYFLFLNVFLVLIYLFIIRIKKQKLSVPALLGVAVTGIYGFLAALVIRI